MGAAAAAATTTTVERVITVEYLEPSMSRELAGKFPDETPFGFDYSQSGIWSPLLPRGRPLSTSLLYKDAQKVLMPMGKARKKKEEKKNKKKKKKNQKNKMIKKTTTTLLEFSPNPSPKAIFKGFLRAAARRFKVQGKSTSQKVLLDS